jgi:hypothetical protein
MYVLSVQYSCAVVSVFCLAGKLICTFNTLLLYSLDPYGQTDGQRVESEFFSFQTYIHSHLW